MIEKGSPQQNADVERVNGSMRDEVLNGETFHTVLEARVVLAGWVVEYNTRRPHRGLRMMTPAAFSESISRAADESDLPHKTWTSPPVRKLHSQD